jgi:hypothetical protein
VKPRRAPTTALDHLIGQAEWGREHILIDEWGPYDFRSPKIWRRGKPAGSNASEDGRIHLEIFGPAGKWKTISARGAQVIGPGTGSVPGSIDLKLSPGKASSLQLTLEYSGAQIVTPVGQVIPAGTPYRFIYSQTPKPNATVNGSLTARRHLRKVS